MAAVPHMRLVRYPASGGVEVGAVEIGDGPAGVLLVPEAGVSGLCGWLPYAAHLAAQGFHVLAYDFRCEGNSGCPKADAQLSNYVADVAGGIRTLRDRGASDVAVMGASFGGSVALVAGARLGREVAGVVDLSGDRLAKDAATPPGPHTAARAAPALRRPVLFAVAREDRYISVGDERRLYERTAAASKDLVVMPPIAGHGWALLNDAEGWSKLSPRVVRFLHQVT